MPEVRLARTVPTRANGPFGLVKWARSAPPGGTMPTPGRPVPHCRAGATRGVARRLTLQERRSPGEPQHPRVAETYARINDKLRASGKRTFVEVAERF